MERSSKKQANVITVASAKGGAGKTILCSSIAMYLSRLGYKVLLIDGDVSTQGMTILFDSEKREAMKAFDINKITPFGLFEFIPKSKTNGSFTSVPDQQITYHTFELLSSPGVDVLPTTYSFIPSGDDEKMREFMDKFEDGLKFLLQKHINPVTKQTNLENYDYIIFDAEAGLDVFSIPLFNPNVSGKLIFVSEFDPQSITAIKSMVKYSIQSFSRENIFVVFNKLPPVLIGLYRKEFFANLRVGEIMPIPWLEEVVLANAESQLLFKEGKFSLFFVEVVQSISCWMDVWMDDEAKEKKNSAQRDILKPFLDDAVARVGKSEHYEDRIGTFRWLLKAGVPLVFCLLLLLPISIFVWQSGQSLIPYVLAAVLIAFILFILSIISDTFIERFLKLIIEKSSLPERYSLNQLKYIRDTLRVLRGV